MTIDFNDTIIDEVSNPKTNVVPIKRAVGRPKGSAKPAGNPKQTMQQKQDNPAAEWHPSKRSNEEIELILSRKFVFQYETFTESCEIIRMEAHSVDDSVSEVEDHDYTDVNGFARTQSHGEVQDVLRNESVVKKVAQWSARKNKYNYVLQYLESCQESYEAELIEKPGYSPLEDVLSCFQLDCAEEHGDANASRIFIAKWLLGCVAKAYREDGFQNPVLTFSGGQKAGKSFFAKWLASGLGRKRDDLFHSGEIRPDDKDHKITSATTWIWDVSEIDATTRRQDISAMKDFITKESFKTRRPYAFCDSKFRAKANFIASLNHDRFLKDETGNRRYFVITLQEAGGIDWRYSKDVDVNHLWGQLTFLFKCGEDLNSESMAFPHLPIMPELTKSETDRQNRLNDAAFQSDNENLDESLGNWLRFTGKPEHRVASVDILGMVKSHLPAQHGHDLNDAKWLRMISAFMTRKKAKTKQLKVHGSNIRGYIGVTWRDGHLRTLANAPL